MDKDIKDIIKKIQKILRLAEKAGTEEEARTAMQMAHEMLTKYNLSLGDVNSFTDQDCNEESFSFKGQSMPGHIKLLVNAMNLLFNCRGIFVRDRRKKEISATFIGLGADPVVACQTYQFLLQFAKRKARERMLKASEKADYFFGFAHSILKRVLAIHDEANSANNALVPVRDAAIRQYMKQKYPNTKTARAIHKKHVSDSLFAGLADGKKASLDRPVEKGSQMQAIGA